MSSMREREKSGEFSVSMLTRTVLNGLRFVDRSRCRKWTTTGFRRRALILDAAKVIRRSARTWLADLRPRSVFGESVRAISPVKPKPMLLSIATNRALSGDRPAPGTALVDQPADFAVPIADRQGFPQATARANRLVYATMTGTDIALYRLDKTYAQLLFEGAKVFQLTSTPMRTGDQFTMMHSRGRWSCTAEAVVNRLREGGYAPSDRLPRSPRRPAAPNPTTMTSASASQRSDIEPYLPHGRWDLIRTPTVGHMSSHASGQANRIEPIASPTVVNSRSQRQPACTPPPRLTIV
jgi:hypothetical protein